MNTLKDNTIYYTIIKNDNIEAVYALEKMLRYFNIEMQTIYKDELGKPFFKDLNIHFNYSHSKDYIACAISKYNVGIDIENADIKVSKSMINICHLNEANALEEYVKRESYCKLTGQGISIIFNEDNFADLNSKCTLIKNNELVCSICSEIDKPNIEYIDIN